jgi:hypothetical protein
MLGGGILCGNKNWLLAMPFFQNCNPHGVYTGTPTELLKYIFLPEYIYYIINFESSTVVYILTHSTAPTQPLVYSVGGCLMCSTIPYTVLNITTLCLYAVTVHHDVILLYYVIILY